MQFNSYIFILLFLPVFVLLYFLLNRIGKLPGKLLIIVAGLLFTLYAGTDSFIVLCVSAVLNLLLSIVLSKIKNGKKIVLAAMVILNIALLLYYKYTNFVILSINSQFGLDIVTRKILIPLGISFFTFQQITYALSVYRGEIEKVSVPDFLAYTFYFPKLIMGPLAEAKDFIAQLNDSALKKFQRENLAVGIKLFSFGLFKKMILADTFSKGVSWGFTNLSVTTAGDLFLVMLFYTFEIYFDFSGYSDMAVGVSKMINITLPMNFDSPYKALSIRDFWKRWHMSLTSFLTKYIYFPLGGSRKGKVRT
jgi:alginate O-acetyltransferase complex protein AlgI